MGGETYQLNIDKKTLILVPFTPQFQLNVYSYQIFIKAWVGGKWGVTRIRERELGGG
jgi:hypothetical protein